MIELKSNDPRELKHRQLGIGGKYDASQVKEFRFEHPKLKKGRVALTESELSALCEMSSSTVYGRDLKNMRDSPPGSWGQDKARMLEEKLIPSGLLENEPTDHSDTVYRLSEMARTGEYVAVVDETKPLPMMEPSMNFNYAQDEKP